jgi:hypothetical protein
VTGAVADVDRGFSWEARLHLTQHGEAADP